MLNGLLGLFFSLYCVQAISHPLDIAFLNIKIVEKKVNVQLDISTDLCSSLGPACPENIFASALTTESIGFKSHNQGLNCRAQDESIQKIRIYSNQNYSYRKTKLFYCDEFVDEIVLNLIFIKSMVKSYQVMASINSLGNEYLDTFNIDRVASEIKINSGLNFKYFILMGIKHIGALPSEWYYGPFELKLASGIDHIIFLIGLILISSGLQELLLCITAFTIGHSLTLGLSSLSLISLNPNIAEILIALTIFIVGLEASFSSNHTLWKYVMVLFFGLIHGLGFAEAIKELQISEINNFLLALFNFNVGIELGQLIILILFVPIVLRLKKTQFAGGINKIFGVCISILGLYWFSQLIYIWWNLTANFNGG